MNISSVLWKLQENDSSNILPRYRTSCQRSFHGHYWPHHGLKPDLTKIHTIISMKAATNVEELQCFPGMANYLTRFLSHLEHLMKTLHQLTYNV